MASEFRQTSIALRSDRGRGRRSLLALAALAVVSILIGGWLSGTRVRLYAVSEAARLQARDQVHPIDTLVAGRVATVQLPVGGSVRAGDVVMTLDVTDARLRLAEARVTVRGLAAQIQSLEAEIAARDEALVSTRSLGRASLSEAEAVRREIEAGARFARRERARADLMRQAGVVAAAEADRADVTMVQANAALRARRQRLSVLDSEARRDVADRRANNESLRRNLAILLAQRDSADVQVERLEVECERHTVRAPIDGVLGQVRAPQVGSVVAAGQTLAVVTPVTDLQLVADFAPASAIGRVHLGQRAHMRVAGFPWTQYGMLRATVAAVSSEVFDGRIRVVLQLDERTAPLIPRRHGMVGEVEIELDEVSPAVLIARAAGRLLEQGESR
jgi:multidrug resistance efflux pump